MPRKPKRGNDQRHKHAEFGTCTVNSRCFFAHHPIQIEYTEWYNCGGKGVGIDTKLENGQVKIGFYSLPPRRKILKRAASEKALVYATHFYPIIPGYVVPKGERWKFQPISMN